MPAEARAQKGIDPVPWLFALYFFVVSGAAMVIGAHDAALSHANLGVTAPGAILLALGVLFFFAACKLTALGRRRLWSGPTRPPCSRLVVAAIAFAVFVGLYVFFSGLKGSGTQRLIVLAIAVVMVAVAGVGLWYFGDEVDITAARVGAVVLAMVGTIVGVGQCWYQNQYLPSRAGRAVALSVGLERIDRQGNNDMVRAKLDYQNIGSRSVYVIGSAYTFTGSRVVRCSRPANVGTVEKRPFESS